jgi:hypothetical protein
VTTLGKILENPVVALMRTAEEKASRMPERRNRSRILYEFDITLDGQVLREKELPLGTDHHDSSMRFSRRRALKAMDLPTLQKGRFYNANDRML